MLYFEFFPGHLRLTMAWDIICKALDMTGVLCFLALYESLPCFVCKIWVPDSNRATATILVAINRQRFPLLSKPVLVQELKKDYSEGYPGYHGYFWITTLVEFTWIIYTWLTSTCILTAMVRAHILVCWPHFRLQAYPDHHQIAVIVILHCWFFSSNSGHPTLGS